ncbi:MAG: pullulanase-type alpha-1,6-glucosidase [Caldilineaceae bacterium]
MRSYSLLPRRLNLLLTIALLFSIAPITMPQPVWADHTPSPSGVALVGDLQAEVGCPGDWQPECALSELTYDPADDLWQGAFALPAGAWAYKVALNDTWDENYGANAQPNGANIPLTLAAPTTVKFYYDHHSHWITDNQSSVIAVAPGSFQSALGCPGDWQPDCLRSWLQDPDGDGLYTFSTTTIPAGAYEAKVALNESWDLNYGAGGIQNGDNIPFTVANSGDTVTFAYDAASHLLTITVEPSDIGEDLAAIVQTPARHPVQDSLFYFVMPDRFANGSSANDSGGLSGDRSVTGLDVTDKGYYHGGDLAGLLGKFDYLEQMGVTAIWMTPMFKNKPVQGSGANESAGYHGYWTVDYTQMDPHFGANADMTALVSAAHARDMKVFFDIITNHTADVIQYAEGVYSYRNKTDFPYRDASGIPFNDRDYAGSNDFPALDPAISFAYTPIVPAAEANIKVPAWLNDPIYYHNRGDSTFSGENSLYGDFFGLDDLFTEEPAVRAGLIQIFEDAVSAFDVDGFRIDTMKHVNAEFWREFAPALNDYAASHGKPNFFMFGEVYSANEQLLSFYPADLNADAPDVNAVLDFGFQEAARDFASKSGATTNLQSFFAKDDWFIDADSNATQLPTFLGNHDMGRIGFFLQTDNPGAADAELLARDQLAHALMYLSRGMPVVYYGDEQGFTGTGGDKDARQDMFPSQVADYNANDLIGTTSTTADDNFDPTHPLYQTLAVLAQLSKENPAFRTGAQIHRVSSGAAGIYAFSRIDRDQQIEYVVALNNSNVITDATVPTFYGNGVQFDAIYGATDSLTTDAGGSLALTVPALGAVVYKASTTIPASAAAPAVALSGLADGQEVALGSTNIDGNDIPNRVELRADVVGHQYAEVTFAVRVSGATEWTPVGVDDNPPYRVYYDASSVPSDSTFDVIAVVNDLNGHLRGSKVTGLKPVAQSGGGNVATYKYAVIHYQRSDNDYGDETTGNYNDFWGLHLWGDAIDASEGTEWTTPKPFLGEDGYGRFAWIKLQDAGKDVNFIVHRGDVKDGTDADRLFNPATDGPEIWLKQDDPNVYTAQAAAQGFVTIHYSRPDATYTGWGLHLWGDAIADGVGTDWANPRPFDGVDSFGAYWNVPIKDATQPVNFIIHNGDTKDPGPNQAMNPSDGPAVWVKSASEVIYTQACSATDQAIFHYRRDAADYGDYSSSNSNDFWGMHNWLDIADSVDWAAPRKPVATDKFGVVFQVPLIADAQQIGYIFHRGDTKDPGPDQFLEFKTYGCEVWQLQGADVEAPYVLPILKGAVAAGDLSKQKAHWIDQNTVAWNVDVAANQAVRLYYAANGGMTLVDNVMTAADGYLDLIYDPLGLSDAQKAAFPYLAAFKTFKVKTADVDMIPAILKGQLAVALVLNDGSNFALNATGLQIPGVLDALYTYTGPLGISYHGAVPTLRLWAPTARAVKLQLFAGADAATASQVIDLTPGAQGIWSVTGDAAWTGQYYLYEVEVYVHSTGQVEHNLVTDPYSVALSTNSERSLLVNLAAPALKPQGWNQDEKPPLAAPEDSTLYELHVRDFSINDVSVPEADRGTFNAFTHPDSNGMKHLEALAEAGLTHVHLLPAFDCATINENKAERVEPTIPDAAPDSDQQQAAVMATADQDGFNWCYDPYHYTVPEGSYSTNPEGVTRIVEFRKMVQALHAAGLRVVMDVVYNHTNASGQAPKSVLDKIVPGYYHRLNLDGQVETSTCCQNTATEHAMMEKLMVDSLVTWATEYDVDGFRFDLMGHHMKANMEKVRDALHAIDPTIYIYGEGWNFGEVADNARGVNATQLNLAGTGIGTFNDRLRDAVRGGGPFDGSNPDAGTSDLIKNQGFISGLYYEPNASNSGSAAELDELLLSADQIRVGLAGNLADYEFVDRNGNLVKGSQVDYNGAPAGYTQDPQEHIAYVEAHDNQTLWDISAYKHAAGVSLADRVRAQNLGIDFTMLAQGVPFFQAGEDLLRSKSMDRNSYNSGDWFNKLDFTYQHNNWGVGLPPEADNGNDWPFMQPLLANPALNPTPDDIAFSAAHFQTMLQVRQSSPLFRLQTAADVEARLAFANTGPSQIPGLIVMTLSDRVDGLPDLDPNHELIAVLFNATGATQSFTAASLQGTALRLHPALAHGADSIVQGASFDSQSGTFTIPARTTAVFVDGAAPAAITIALEAHPQSRRNFRFTGDLGEFKLDDPKEQDHDRYASSLTQEIDPGTYTVKEKVPGSWRLTDITCDSATVAVDRHAQSVAITVAAGEAVTCTFVNQHRSRIRVDDDRDENDGQDNREDDGDQEHHDHKSAPVDRAYVLYDGEGALLTTQAANQTGGAAFGDLAAGSYTLCEALPAGSVSRRPDLANPAFGNQACYPLTIAPGQSWSVSFASVDGSAASAGEPTMTPALDDADEAGYDVDVTALSIFFYLPLVRQ